MGKVDDFDRKYHLHLWYISGISLLFAGMVWSWNMWLVGGGLFLFMVAVWQDADERGLVRHKVTKCDRCIHTFEERKT